MRTTVKQMTQNLLTKITLIALCGWVMVACNQKEESTPPPVSNLFFEAPQVSDVDLTMASLEIQVKGFTEGEVSDFGFVWSETSNPVVGTNNQKSFGGLARTDTYRHTITDLKSNTQYFMRGYFTKADEVVYSDEVNFTTVQLTFDKVTPNSGGIGDEITLVGQNFSTDLTNIQVSIGEISSTITSVSTTRDSIKVKIPEGLTAWESAKVQVTIGNDVLEKDAALLVTGWIRKNDFGGGANGLAAGFTINGKGYVVGGVATTGRVFQKGTWEYDPTTDQWTQKKDHPDGISFHEGFSMNGKGYVAWGSEDLWQYDPTNDTWIEKLKSSSSAKRFYAFSFLMGGNFITGGGLKLNDAGGGGNDMWLYNPNNDTWKKLQDAPFEFWHAASFTIGIDAYVTGGSINNHVNNPSKALWQYQANTDTWVQKADFAGTPRSQSVAFSDEFNRKGYVGLGYDGNTVHKDMWQYDSITNSWTQLSGSLSEEIANPTVLKINGRIFLVGGTALGQDSFGSNDYSKFSSSVWEFILPSNQ